MSGMRQDGFRPTKTITFKQNNKPSKPKAWSHQDDLQRAIGHKIRIKIMGEEKPIEGTLEAADQFSLKLRQPDSVYLGVYYKSALTYFMVL